MELAGSLSRDQAYERIREMILAGRLTPDRPLSERGLADSLGLGRTPVREALKALARDGLLTVAPMRGTFVRLITLEEVREIYEVRLALEGMAAYLAAERGPTEALSAFGPRFAALAAAGEAADIAEIQETGVAFHDEMIRASRNRHLRAVYETLRLQNELAVRLTRVHDHARVHTTIGEHHGVLRAIESREPARAQTLICEHLRQALAARVRILERLAGFEPVRPAPATAASSTA